MPLKFILLKSPVINWTCCFRRRSFKMVFYKSIELVIMSSSVQKGHQVTDHSICKHSDCVPAPVANDVKKVFPRTLFNN